jgi:hypothetical protein
LNQASIADHAQVIDNMHLDADRRSAASCSESYNRKTTHSGTCFFECIPLTFDLEVPFSLTWETSVTMADHWLANVEYAQFIDEAKGRKKRICLTKLNDGGV